MNTIKSIAFLLFFLQLNCVNAALVYVQYEPRNVIQHDTLAQFSDAQHEILADLVNGKFRAKAASSGRYSYAGILSPLVFTNNTGNTISWNHGQLKVQVDGVYDLNFNPQLSSAARSNTVFTVTNQTTGLSHGTGINHHVVEFYDSNGAVSSSQNNLLTGNTSNNGATYNIINSSLNRLTAEILMPAMTLDDGDTLTLSFLLQAISSHDATADFSNTATLSFTLPQGVTLDHNGSTSLAWVTNVPVPSAIWLSLTGLGLLFSRAIKRP